MKYTVLNDDTTLVPPPPINETDRPLYGGTLVMANDAPETIERQQARLVGVVHRKARRNPGGHGEITVTREGLRLTAVAEITDVRDDPTCALCAADPQ